MPLRWKIFFALNILVALPAFILLILLIGNSSADTSGGEELLYFIIAVFSLLMMTVNGFLNIFLLQRFYPDKLVTGGARKLNLLSLIVTAVVTAVMLIACYFAAAETFDPRNAGRDTSGKVALVIFLLILLMQVIILIMQAQLPGLINRNHRNNIHSLIDSIGK